MVEQKAKVRELVAREKEAESRLIASRLESARAAALAEDAAAEVEHLHAAQVRI